MSMTTYPEVPIIKAYQSPATTAAWTSATASDTVISMVVSNYGTVELTFNPSGSITAGQLNFEVSDDGGTNWYPIGGERVDVNVVELVFSLNGTTKKAWQFNIAAFTNFRVRLNPAITGAGTANLRMQASGLIFPQTGESGGATPYSVLWPANTTGVNIKSTPGVVYGWSITNNNAAARYVKLYNKASAPTTGTDTPYIRLLIPGAGAGAGNNFSIPGGIVFPTGIGIAVTTGVTDADTTAPTANDVQANIHYK